MAKAKKDRFVQLMKLQTDMSAANAITFDGISLGTPLFEYAGILLERIDYFPGVSSYGEMQTLADVFDMAVCGSDNLADFDIGQPEIFDRLRLAVSLTGAPADYQIAEWPIVHDFSSMSGGGLLVPAQEIYLGVDSAGFVGAGGGNVRIYYTWIEMVAADYLELVQRLRILST